MQVLYERKIIGRVCGPDKEQFQAAFGYELLKSTVQSMGPDHPYTVLVPDMRGVDPDDWTSPIPYEKGYYFLRYLENLVGGTEVRCSMSSPWDTTASSAYMEYGGTTPHFAWVWLFRNP